MVVLTSAVLGFSAGCKDRGPDKPDGWPFPSAHLVEDGHVSIPADLLPHAEGGTLFDVERLRVRTGFSVVQTTMIDPEVALDASSLPTRADAGTAGSVQIWDLDAGEPILCFAELDAYPELHEEHPTLIVRPLEPMAPGHRVAVITTGDLLTASGDVFTLPWFDALRDGHPAKALEDWEDHYTELVDELEDLGVGDVRFAVDFPIGDGTDLLRSVAHDLPTPSAWTLSDIADVDDGVDLPDGTWRRLEGTFTTESWLSGTSFVLDGDGHPVAQGTAEADLYVHMPDSIRDAAPGSVPIWIFGHGIFKKPGMYLSDEDDEDHFVDLADRAGAILVGTVWRGLTYDDLPVAVAVGDDFGRISDLTDMLAQGVLDTIQLSSLVRDGGLLDDPALLGLPDPDALFYFGVSLGSIEGAVLQALDPGFDAAVLHVGGSAWSTMLERSSNWPVFEDLVVADVPSARERQLAYAATQLFWDPVDPAGYTAELADRPILWQQAIGDEQVPNLTTELLLRGVGAPLLEPAVDVPEGIETIAGPVLEGPAFSQFDPERGLPEESNRPAEVTGAHETPRTWDGMKAQTIRFLDRDDPGRAEHFCGTAPCTADNTGAK
jgi:hypothetical protein